MGEDASAADYPIQPAGLARLVAMIDDGSITGAIAKRVYPMMIETGKAPDVLVEEHGLKPVDDSALEPVIRKVLDENPKMVDDIRAGKMKAIGGIVGQVMKATGGKANPQTVQSELRRLLGID
jgi:aspartyl-tRNA(Asn)/glutamyl-tRNA(Gln) amidotransferase subunit B